MTRIRLRPLVAGIALTFVATLTAGCSGRTDSPTSPSPLQLSGTWSGTWVDNIGGAFNVSVPLTQSANRVSGVAVVSRVGYRQDNVLDGTLAGNTLTMQFSWTAPGCSGSGTMTLVASTTAITGGYTGGTSCGGAGNVGQISLTRQP